jgi:predicted phage tail protein
VQVDARNGTQTQDIIKGYTDTENEIAVGVELKSGSPWVQSLSNTEMSAVRVTLGWP